MQEDLEQQFNDLESRFAELGSSIQDSPLRDAVALLHSMIGLLHESASRSESASEASTAEASTKEGKGRPANPGARAGDAGLAELLELHQHAPNMEGQAECAGPQVGSKAPSFTLPDTQGVSHSLEQYRGQPVLLVFYPLDWSPGCSKQLDLYAFEWDEFTRRGMQLLAISVDSLYSHGAWKYVRNLPFPLLADFSPHGGVARSYSLFRNSDGFSERALVLIDAKGIIRFVEVSPRLEHVPDIYTLFENIDTTLQTETA